MAANKKIQGQTIKNQIENPKEDKPFLFQLPIKDPLEILQEVLGSNTIQENHKTEFRPGESIDIAKLLKTKKETTQNPPRTTENRFIITEERREVERKISSLKIQLEQIIKEVKLLAKSTKTVEEQVKAIPDNLPQEPGIYHIGFFEEILKIIKNARAKIEEASVWLSFATKRAQKKNYWARYRKGGASFLLSPDHYLTRSAG